MNSSQNNPPTGQMAPFHTRKPVTEVLIVDNDPAVANVLEEFLNEEGFLAKCESDGIRALQCIEQRQPDLVLADVMMPRLNGIDLVNVIHRRWSEIEVILMSASESPATIECAFIQKPFDLDLVKDAIIRCTDPYGA